MSRTYRFFISDVSTVPLLTSERSFSLEEKMEPEIFFQLMKVLRCKPGDNVLLLSPVEFNPSELPSRNFEYQYEIASAQKKTIAFQFVQKVPNDHELPFVLDLVLCLPNKPDKLEFIIQKAVELGVSDVVLVKGDFSQMKHELRPERLMKIMREAAEQSERAFIPKLEIHGDLMKFLDDKKEEAENILVAMERIEEHSNPKTPSGLSGLLKEKMIQSSVNAGKKFSIAIGPEGGFSDEEKTFIRDYHFPCFSLGKRILRMETAVIVSLGIASMVGEINS